jgi:hypothetical protein
VNPFIAPYSFVNKKEGRGKKEEGRRKKEEGNCLITYSFFPGVKVSKWLILLRVVQEISYHHQGTKTQRKEKEIHPFSPSPS